MSITDIERIESEQNGSSSNIQDCNDCEDGRTGVRNWTLFSHEIRGQSDYLSPGGVRNPVSFPCTTARLSRHQLYLYDWEESGGFSVGNRIAGFMCRFCWKIFCCVT